MPLTFPGSQRRIGRGTESTKANKAAAVDLFMVVAKYTKLQIILRDFHPFATFQCRLMGDHSTQGHVQGIPDMHVGQFVEQDGFDKIVCKLTMGTAMAATVDAWWCGFSP